MDAGNCRIFDCAKRCEERGTRSRVMRSWREKGLMPRHGQRSMTESLYHIILVPGRILVSNHVVAGYNRVLHGRVSWGSIYDIDSTYFSLMQATSCSTLPSMMPRAIDIHKSIQSFNMMYESWNEIGLKSLSKQWRIGNPTPMENHMAESCPIRQRTLGAWGLAYSWDCARRPYYKMLNARIAFRFESQSRVIYLYSHSRVSRIIQ